MTILKFRIVNILGKGLETITFNKEKKQKPYALKLYI